MQTQKELHKVFFVGEPGVGKTSLIACLCKQGDSLKYSPTVRADFHIQKFFLKNRSLTWQLWDSPGQKRYVEASLAFYKNSSACVVCVDGSRPLRDGNNPCERFPLTFIQEQSAKDDIPIVIAVTKSDLDRQLSDDDLKALKSHYRTDKVVFCSAKCGDALQSKRDEGLPLFWRTLLSVIPKPDGKEEIEDVWPSSQPAQPLLNTFRRSWPRDLFYSFLFGAFMAFFVLIVLVTVPPASHAALVGIDVMFKLLFHRTLSSSIASNVGLELSVVAFSMGVTFLTCMFSSFGVTTFGRLFFNSRLFIKPVKSIPMEKVPEGGMDLLVSDVNSLPNEISSTFGSLWNVTTTTFYKFPAALKGYCAFLNR